MKPKRKLKKWVKVTLLLLPLIVIICQLFFIGLKISNSNNTIKKIEIESRCKK